MDNEPIRVAQIIGSVCKGGVEAVVFNYYRMIDKSKVQFDFIIDEDSPCEIPADIMALGCKVYKILSYKHLTAYIGSLKKIISDNQYKIAHSHMNTLSVFALFAGKQAGVPVRIAHSHSTAGKGEFARNVMKYMLRPFSRLFATHYFACSEYAGRWLLGSRAVERGQVTVIRNAIDTEKYSFNPDVREQVRRELGISDRFVVAHCGRFMPQKNHVYLIDIFAEVHKRDENAILLLIGDGELKPFIEAKVQRLGLSDSVKFLGARDDVHRLYQAMDVFVLPSLYEGLAVVRVEAVAAGLPCLVAAGQSAELETINGKFIGIAEKDIGTWCDSILECKSMQRKDGGEMLRLHGWDIDETAAELLVMYEKLLSNINQNV
ncbi:MAG: glycosyltransferase [Clostridiales bacterium]|nr:glycosyltransferase [Clostridiales bacterium]